MKTNKLVLALAAATLAAGSANLYADGDQPWHLTAQFGQMDLDSARMTEDDDSWISFGFGRFFGDHFSLDVEYDEYAGTFSLHDTIAPGSTYDKWSLSNWGLMGRYHFGTSAVRPYLALGAGWQKHGNVSDTDSNESLSYGLGLSGQSAPNANRSARRGQLEGHSQGPAGEHVREALGHRGHHGAAVHDQVGQHGSDGGAGQRLGRLPDVIVIADQHLDPATRS